MREDGDVRGRGEEKYRKRLGYGAYGPGQPGVRDRERAREEFLDAVERREPKVLEELERDVLSLYQAWRDRSGESGESIVRATDAALRESSMSSHLAPLRQALNAWLRRWNLETPWCRERALATMERWCKSRADREGWSAGRARWRPVLTFEERHFKFEHAGWEPTIRGRADAAERIRDEFEKNLQAHLDHCDELARERGYRPSPQKQEELHFDWLVRYQVLTEPFASIARTPSEKRAVRTVKDAVTSLARLIDLPLRPPDRPGRPRRTVE